MSNRKALALGRPDSRISSTMLTKVRIDPETQMYQYSHMASPIVSNPSRSACSEQHDVSLSPDDRAEFVEAPEHRNRSGRGLLTGVLLGAGLWAAILVATGVVKI